MSANEQNDWSDSLDFESLADEHEDLGSTDAQEALDDESAEDLDGFDEPLVDEVTDQKSVKKPSLKSRWSFGLSGIGMGMLFAFSILVAAIGSGGALMAALGVDPVSLWQPQGFSQVDQLLNLDRHPLNLVYIVLLATVLLTLLGAWVITRTVGRASNRAKYNAHLIDLLADLRIDEKRGWQSHDLKAHPALAAFVDENLGSWRLLEARQRRTAGLEGELKRLAKAAADDDREDLKGRYDHPSVGSLADEFLRHLAGCATSQQESDAIRAKDREESEAIVRAASDAAGWNLSYTDQVGVQNAAASGLELRLQEMVASLTQDDGADSLEEARQVLVNLRNEMRESSGGGGEEEIVTELNNLVERETKLAFQIAMEVARLGSRGERLLPMTQTLEELSTGFRKTAERLSDPGRDGLSARERWERHLTALHERLGETDDSRTSEVTCGLHDLVPIATELAARLGSLATDFDQQTERLRDLGRACASLTGVDFDADNVAPPSPDESAGDDLGLTRFEPFSDEAEDDSTLQVVDPFDTGEPEPADPIAALEPVADLEPPAPVPDPSIAPVNDHELTLDESPAVSPPPVPQKVAPQVSLESAPVADAPVADAPPAPPSESVYDLTDLGGTQLDDAPALATAPPSESVYDLADLGGTQLDDAPALALATEPAPAEPAESIYDLSEFGAERLG